MHRLKEGSGVVQASVPESVIRPLVLATCFGAFAAALGWRAVDPILPLLAAEFHVGLADAVLFVSGYGFALALTQLLFGPVGDAWGKLRVLRGMLVLVAASLVMMSLVADYASAVLARVLGGAFAGGVIPVSLALISERIPVAQRQAALGPFVASLLGGQMMGAALSGVIVDVAGWRPVFVVCAVTVIVALAMNLWLLGRGPEARHRFSFGGALGSYRDIVVAASSRPVLAVLIAEGVFVLGVIPFVGAMVMSRAEGSTSAAGIVIGTFAIGGVAFGFMVRRVLAWLGPWHMLRVGAAIAGLALLSMVPPVHWSFSAALFFLVGFGFYMFHNTIQLHVTELSPEARGASVSIGSFFFMCGQAIGPLVWAPVAEGAGYTALFAAAGLGTVAMGLLSAWSLAERARRNGSVSGSVATRS